MNAGYLALNKVPFFGSEILRTRRAKFLESERTVSHRVDTKYCELRPEIQKRMKQSVRFAVQINFV